MLIAGLLLLSANPKEDLAYLRQVAQEVVASAKVEPGAGISNAGSNTTGFALRVPGGTQNYYPAFWIRDAAMMLGADFVPAKEVEGWVRLVASTQAGVKGINFDHGLRVPPFSIPDHITLKGEPCWYPGAYSDQGVGDYGFLPPADDAFYFIQMVHEHFRLTKKPSLFASSVATASGQKPLRELCERAFESVAVDPETGLVVCDAEEGKTRVDWGFCDSITKTGQCLMPSLLRWQAALRLADLFDAVGWAEVGNRYREEANQIRAQVVPVFYRSLPNNEGLLLSATGLGRKDDVWSSAFAVWLGILPKDIELAVSRHLLTLYQSGVIVAEGQERHIPLAGEFGGYWEKARSAPNTYQNGGYWATPTGWLAAALMKVDRSAGQRLVSELVASIRANRTKGAPFEWINPVTKSQVNGNYASSAALVYISLIGRL